MFSFQYTTDAILKYDEIVYDLDPNDSNAGPLDCESVMLQTTSDLNNFCYLK